MAPSCKQTAGEELLSMLRQFRKELEALLVTLDAGSKPAKKKTARPRRNDA